MSIFLFPQDFDGDGLPELLVTADYGGSRMFWNDGSKGFRECTRDCGLRGEQVKNGERRRRGEGGGGGGGGGMG